MSTIKCDLLTPGFIDIHLHGIGGSNDLMEFWQTPEYTLSRLTKFGTTSVMATMIVPGEQEGYNKCMKACKAVNNVMNKTGLGTVVRGIHSEGPIISQLGALREPLDLLNLDKKGFEDMIDSMGPHVKIMTISPS